MVAEKLQPVGSGIDVSSPSNRKVYHLECVDYFSQWVEQKASAEEVSQTFIQAILSWWGVPYFLLSVYGFQFPS